MRGTTALLLLPAALLSACATHAVDQSYGQAWAQMQRAQTYNLRAGDDSGVLGIDPIQAQAALDAMRKDTADRSVVKPAPLINISQQASSGGGGQ